MPVSILSLFLAQSWICLQCIIVVFIGHFTYVLIKFHLNGNPARGLLVTRPKLKPTEQVLIVLLGYRRVKSCIRGLQRKKEDKDQETIQASTT